MEVDELYNLFLNSTGVTTDSRHVKPNELFFALSGPNFNGNQFAQEALDKGASYAFIDDQTYSVSEKCVLVKNTLLCLQNLAAHHRNQLNIPFIGITGTNGKTTTKELVKATLDTTYNTIATQGNFNNHIGVPLTLLKVQKNTEIAIIEMGANHIGEINTLCLITRPTHGIITNIGKAHLEGFGSEKGVKLAKQELFDALAKNNGTAFINQDLKYLPELAKHIKNKVKYGTYTGKNIRYELKQKFPFLTVNYYENGDKFEIHTKIFGSYNFANIMAAICIGRYFKVETPQIVKAISNYIPDNNRSQIIKKGTNQYILDAYNANPNNMKAAISHFADLEAEKKALILGDMLELGGDSYSEHLNIINMVKDMGFEQVILVGNIFGQMKNNINCLHFNNSELLCKWFAETTFSDTSFLIKGSRGIGLERLLA